MEENIILNELSAKELWEKIYNKELNCKKNVLEYIEMMKILKKSNASEEEFQENYNFIYDSIDAMADKIKPNTIMYLKNQLKAKIGKYVAIKDPQKENGFIEFFKKAYPEKNRRKDFTWVLMDINKISEEQIWTTLTYINRECLKNNIRLNGDEKSDIIKIIEKLIAKNNIKYINQVKSLEKLLSVLKIKVVPIKDRYSIKSIN
ncbi:hypothetical protein [Clostridium botulinum]|uniref:Uncharacterized protein n=1 Tax=Clostridium botulinum TaxID=1491 RepID=A0A6B4N5X8_CLOBO|nr:hypothetical protein [Clostridium botulinum]KIL06754.1 hypothetical protein SR42_16585 [Clostridium botulinum]MBN1062252.1 hypothetical protein [Clostridium botulinum]MBN1071665.1 hypothetical protein [Clostridium botulinum]MBY6809463.1 hypothetical protein [Clostridium botulinum]MBY6822905.1 hypothetical protein [Clostridium botulinum]